MANLSFSCRSLYIWLACAVGSWKQKYHHVSDANSAAGQFAAIAGAAVAFEYFLVPETRGLSLEEIEAQLDGDKKPYQ